MHGEVIERIQLSPTMVRIVMGGSGLDDYVDTDHTDQYVNALFVPEGAPYGAPFDTDQLGDVAPEHRPKGRRYTIRWWDPDTRTVAIDFVVHGAVGYAGRWAANAQPGDVLQMVGPHGGYAPAADAASHVLVGDESALPAIAASLEQIAAGRTVTVIAIVDDGDCEIELATPGDLDVIWVHRDGGDTIERVVAAIDGLDVDWSAVDLFVHGEAAEVRAVRKHLVAEHGIERQGTSISPYWRRGETDEQWREHKGEFVKAMNAEV